MNFDYDIEVMVVEKMCIVFGVMFIVIVLFVVLFIECGWLSGWKSICVVIWFDIDNDCCGLLFVVFEDGFGFCDYVEWVFDVLMFFVVCVG